MQLDIMLHQSRGKGLGELFAQSDDLMGQVGWLVGWLVVLPVEARMGLVKWLPSYQAKSRESCTPSGWFLCPTGATSVT